MVSVVIPNYNGIAHLPTCLAALRAQTYTPFEVLLVDNASTDESVACARRAFDGIRIVTLAANRVFAGAANEGIRAARGEIIALLNNDTEAEPSWLSELVASLLQEPEAGMAASKMRLFDRRDALHNAGDGFGRNGLPVNRGARLTDQGQFDGDHFVFSACGGAAAYRRAMLDQIGLFDEDFVAYCEDVDLGWRAQLAGWRCVYAPRAIVYHKLSATGGGALSSYFVGRNVIWVMAKNLPARLWRKYWRRILGAQAQVTLDALKAWRGEAARARLRGQLAGLTGLPRVLRKRRAIQVARRVSDAYLETVLS
ncbi:MAG: glycosyltransferase family 2 protein [Chloroflexi bacterium]|nr:glycosyltransferase family 2 protein [Chloroflexota bacterium]MBI3733896.1 glycosyltransferase family 2 protein [Chloroflexota bacterium]